MINSLLICENWAELKIREEESAYNYNFSHKSIFVALL